MPRKGDLKLDNPRYLAIIHVATKAPLLTLVRKEDAERGTTARQPTIPHPNERDAPNMSRGNSIPLTT
jgi:hypothetical protein